MAPEHKRHIHPSRLEAGRRAPFDQIGTDVIGPIFVEASRDYVNLECRIFGLNDLQCIYDLLADSAARIKLRALKIKLDRFKLVRVDDRARYAAARADADEQTEPSFLPDDPPKEASTSPPLPRTLAMKLCQGLLFIGAHPSHFGAQVAASERMKASVNCLIPVADIAARGSCGLPQPGYT